MRHTHQSCKSAETRINRRKDGKQIQHHKSTKSRGKEDQNQLYLQFGRKTRHSKSLLDFGTHNGEMNTIAGNRLRETPNDNKRQQAERDTKGAQDKRKYRNIAQETCTPNSDTRQQAQRDTKGAQGQRYIEPRTCSPVVARPRQARQK